MLDGPIQTLVTEGVPVEIYFTSDTKNFMYTLVGALIFGLILLALIKKTLE